jgi:hypothetical protein
MLPMRPSLLRCALALVPALLVLAGCASEGARRKTLDSTLYQYAGAIRWSGLQSTWTYVDPALREEEPPSALEIERLGQYRVTGYQVVSQVETAEGLVVQQAQIGVANLHTQVERVLAHREEWRWDPDAKRWWLVGGVPDVRQGR